MLKRIERELNVEVGTKDDEQRVVFRAKVIVEFKEEMNGEVIPDVNLKILEPIHNEGRALYLEVVRHLDTQVTHLYAVEDEDDW